jgi:hypothetical protein
VGGFREQMKVANRGSGVVGVISVNPKPPANFSRNSAFRTVWYKQIAVPKLLSIALTNHKSYLLNYPPRLGKNSPRSDRFSSEALPHSPAHANVTHVRSTTMRVSNCHRRGQECTPRIMLRSVNRRVLYNPVFLLKSFRVWSATLIHFYLLF